MERPLVIYHANCPDGFGAAVAAYCHFRQNDAGPCDFVAASFGQPPPEVTGRQVYILDFSYARQVLKTMCRSAQAVTILDHHLSAEQDLTGLEREHANLRVIFDMDKSGAVLTWEFFHQTPPPLLLLLIQDRDLWRFALEGTNDLYAALQARPFDFQAWAALIDGGELPASLFAEGEAINRYRREMIALHRDKAVIGTIDGYQVPIVNCYNEIASDLLGELAEDHPFAAGYQDQGNQRKWSLRSSASGADVAEIATRFGGGGHQHAAGFITRLPEGLLHISSQEPGELSDAGVENPDRKPASKN
jgi:oligoribonuclease NrnB/cAMP/cGMP phosphodiesterase (DHH superfamily)